MIPEVQRLTKPVMVASAEYAAILELLDGAEDFDAACSILDEFVIQAKAIRTIIDP